MKVPTPCPSWQVDSFLMAPRMMGQSDTGCSGGSETSVVNRGSFCVKKHKEISCENIVRRKKSASQEEMLDKRPTLLAPGFWTFSLQNYYNPWVNGTVGVQLLDHV